jgi:hypothetical protein
MRISSEPQARILLTVVRDPTQGKVFEFTEPDNLLFGKDDPSSNAHFPQRA